MELAPADASRLSAKNIEVELERRGLRATGFLGEDAAALQKVFNAEFAEEQLERHAAALAERQREVEEEEARRRQR
jgi:hypothetical protein